MRPRQSFSTTRSAARWRRASRWAASKASELRRAATAAWFAVGRCAGQRARPLQTRSAVTHALTVTVQGGTGVHVTTQAKTKHGVGAALPRLEDDRLMRGRSRFVGDIKLVGMMEVAFVRSPVAHARLLG